MQYRIAGNFREHKFSRITNRSEKKFRDFYFCDKVTCLTAPPTISRMEMVTHSVYFQRRNDGKISTLISVSVAVGKKLPCQREGANSEDLFAVAAS